MVEDPIAVAWTTGRAAWPDVDLACELFAAHVGARPALAKFPGDLYLAAACLAKDPAALACFDREMLGAARGAIAAIDGSPAFVDEALQRLRVNVLVGEDGNPRLGQFTGHGPLRAWLGIAGARTALMMVRSRKRAREVHVEDDEWIASLASISTDNAELELLKRQYAAAFAAALREAVEGLESRLRAVLRMSFVDALSIDEIGKVYAVHRATAARWIQRACDAVFAETRRLLSQRLGLSGTELERMTALVRSQVDVSLSRLLPGVE